jgi:hypothetical protein
MFDIKLRLFSLFGFLLLASIDFSLFFIKYLEWFLRRADVPDLTSPSLYFIGSYSALSNINLVFVYLDIDVTTSFFANVCY